LLGGAFSTLIWRARTIGRRERRSLGRIGAEHLFSTPDGKKILDALAPLITDLGPLAQVRGIRFLAELGQLKKQQGGRS
jgi:hypothetical protein